MNLHTCALSLGFCIAWLVSGPASSQDWTRFRGPNGTGYVADATIPDTWTASDYVWTTRLPGGGISSPVVWGSSVFLLTADAQSATRNVVCVDLKTGKQKWSREFASVSHRLHRRNRYASSTPCCDEKFVYVAWSEPKHTTVMCLDHAGSTIWTKDLGTWQSQHGFGTSPMIHGEHLYVFDSQQSEQLKRGQSPGSSAMVALDRTTGNVVWETPLSTTRVCYGTPCLYTPPGESPQLIDCNTGNGLFALDPSTGKMLWNLKVFGKRCCSSPVIAGNLLIGSSGSGGGGNHLVAVDPAAGKAKAPAEVYRLERSAPYVPTPVVVNDLLFAAGDNGVVSCLDSKTGEAHWAQRISGGFGSSPIVVGDRLLVIDMDGEATVIRASKKFEKLGATQLGAPAQATPAFSGGYLLLRADDRLMALGPKTL